MDRARWRWFGVFIALAATDCDRPPPEPVEESAAAAASSEPGAATGSQPKTNDEAAGIIGFIQTSQREGLVGRDPKAFMRIWARDAKVISGRTERPDEHDHVVGYAQFERSAHARCKGKADTTLELEYHDERVTIAGDRATVTWRITVKWHATGDGIAGKEQTAERWELRKSPAGWRVVENRFWPQTTTVADKTIRYDRDQWRQMDEAVVRAESLGDSFAQIEALWKAWRLTEALELARKLTAKTPGNADGWAWRARLADRMRLVGEAAEAYQKLRVIETQAEVPGWVEAELARRKLLPR